MIHPFPQLRYPNALAVRVVGIVRDAVVEEEFEERDEEKGRVWEDRRKASREVLDRWRLQHAFHVDLEEFSEFEVVGQSEKETSFAG